MNHVFKEQSFNITFVNKCLSAQLLKDVVILVIIFRGERSSVIYYEAGVGDSFENRIVSIQI